MDVPEIDIAEAARRHAAGAVVIDVREPHEYVEGHVPGAPLIPLGSADYLVVLAPDPVENNRAHLGPQGVLLEPSRIDLAKLSNRRSFNVAMLGLLSRHLALPRESWEAALARELPPALLETNRQAFEIGRQS